MAYDDLVAAADAICLQHFGITLTLRRAATGAESSFVGILEQGVQPEDKAPGDGSAYATVWTTELAVTPPLPELGDEIDTASTVYKIVRREPDPEGGIELLLRQDRTVT